MKEELFDLSDQYEAMLRQGIQLSGEDQNFFIEGRISDLRRMLPAGCEPRRVLDFGCGAGHAVPYLRRAFPRAAVTGVDTSEPAIIRARQVGDLPYDCPTADAAVAQVPDLRRTCHDTTFGLVSDLDSMEPFDLCYVNGVFHHIQPDQRPEALAAIWCSLKPGGYLALFENNPWNPGTRMVMARIPFDRDAIPLSPIEARRTVEQAGFRLCQPVRSLFYFPRILAGLRFAEPWLAPLPLGAQYYVLCQRPA